MRNIFLTVLGLILYVINFGQKQQEIAFDKGVNLLKTGSYKEAIKQFSEVIPKATDKKLKNSVTFIARFHTMVFPIL